MELDDDELKATKEFYKNRNKAKYKIEIWILGSIDDKYENNDIKNILKWYKEKWKFAYENCNCAFSVYENDIEIGFDEKNKFGFFD